MMLQLVYARNSLTRLTSYTSLRRMSSIPNDEEPASTDNIAYKRYSTPRKTFKLSPKFVAEYKEKVPPFGFNGLGELVYKRTYSRVKEDKKNEEWHETVERVVNGTFNMQKRWIDEHQLGWDPRKAQKTAQEMYDKIFHMKFLPPGRGLWAMGSPITEKRELFAALNNCAFVSTDVMLNKIVKPSKPFAFLMDASMLGVGVGFDTLGADGKFMVPGPNTSQPQYKIEIEDSREGWVDSVASLLDSYFLHTAEPTFDYSKIRPAGSVIQGFGGVCSGPDPLRELHGMIKKLLDKNIGKPLTSTAIVDLMNCIGKCVVSGNVRQTAEIAFGSCDDENFLELKNYQMNPERAEYGWTSNNSVICRPGMDYNKICQHVVSNGEPGFFFLENAKLFGRFADPPDHKDIRAQGGNPCLEQTLESFELCCLVETFPNNHTTLDEYLKTLRLAYLYAKTVTLGRTHWAESNRVMLRNRRIGCSMSGIAQFISKRGLGELKKWCEQGYQEIQKNDREFSDWLAIPRSIKTTTIKPSGTVSLLAGASPGMHYPESRYCIRRVRMSRYSDLIPKIKEAGFKVEDCYGDERTVVVEFPIDMGENIRSLKDVSMFEQLSLAAFLQRYWSDNQVSCTVTFNPETEATHLPHALDYFQYQLKGVSFLPRIDAGAYKQMPIEAIDEVRYKEMVKSIKPLQLSATAPLEPAPENFCDADSCKIK